MGTTASIAADGSSAAGHGLRGDGEILLLGNGAGGASADGAGNVPALANANPNGGAGGDQPNAIANPEGGGAGGGADVEETIQQLAAWALCELQGHGGVITEIQFKLAEVQDRLEASADLQGDFAGLEQAQNTTEAGLVELAEIVDRVVDNIGELIAGDRGQSRNMNAVIAVFASLKADVIRLKARDAAREKLTFILLLLMATSIFYFANAKELEHFGHLSMMWAGLALAFAALKDAARAVEIAALRKEMAMIARRAERDDEEDDEEDEDEDEGDDEVDEEEEVEEVEEVEVDEEEDEEE